MPVTVKICTINNKVIKNLLEIRPVYTVFKKSLSQTENTNEFFKFYNNDVNNFSEKYKPLTAEDYARFFSTRASKREAALTRQITTLSYKVGKQMISLAEGMPNEEVFPFNKLQLVLKRGGDLVMEGKELSSALQYVPSQGLPSLLSCLREFQQQLHRPPALSLPRDVMVTNGAQHAIYQCFDLLFEPGDPVLVSEYAYTGVYTPIKPYNPEILGIPEDSNGMIPETIESILEDRLNKGLKMPKVLYINPTGNNPTGVLTSDERRKQIYELACKYNFLILEDDPYMFLNYSDTPVSSFLSMDSCGRVLRADSLSKVVSAGLRAAWITGPAPLVHQMELHMQCEILHSCTLSQAIMLQLLTDKSSLATHLQAVREFYRVRRDALQEALIAEHVADVAEWTAPDAGLFLWLRVKGVDDVYNMVFRTAFERGLMLIPGQAFQYDTAASCTYVRLTFSKVPLEKMREAAGLLVDIIKDEQRQTMEKQPQRFATER